MKRFTSILLTLAMIFTILPMNIFAADETTFTDMTGSEYYAESAEILAELGILAGYEDGSFGADKSITRAEMAAIVCRMLGKEAEAKEAKGKTSFDDVAANHWASGYINIATDEGIINGDGNGKFRPEDDVKYEEAIKMIVCALGYGENVSVDPKDWSKVYLDIAKEKGITENLKGEKGKAATRGDIAVMACNGLKEDLSAPVASLKEGSYRGTQKVKLTTETDGAEIYYTTDGKTPTVESTKYTKEISISKTTTLKAITVKNNVLVSDVMIVEYTIKHSSGGGSSRPSTYSLSFAEAINGYVDTSVAGDYAPNSEIVLTATPNENYSFIKWESSNGGTFDNSNLPITKFTMPSNNVVISSLFELTPEFLFEWDYENNDANYYSSIQGGKSITLSIVAESGTIIEWQCSDGNIIESADSLSVEWTLPDTEGKYTVIATGIFEEEIKRITKTIDVFSPEVIQSFEELDKDVLVLDDSSYYDENDDSDGDGLINSVEKELGTDCFDEDTDFDGVNDYDEVYIYNSNPLHEDTDGDGIIDGSEISFGLNPISNSSDGVNNDTEREFSHIYYTEDNSFSLNISGNANIVSGAIIEEYDNSYLSGIDGIISPIIDITTNDNAQDFTEAILSYNFSDDSIDSEDIEDFSFVYINEETLQFEKIPTQIDTENKIATANLSHFSKYVLANIDELFVDFGKADIIFAIDNSGSMSSNDRNDVRLDVVKDLVNDFSGDYQYAVVKFTSSANIVQSITSNKEELYANVNNMYGTCGGGTSISAAINTSLSTYSSDNRNKVLILLTDGADSGTSAIRNAVTSAISQGVTIYTIGLGDSVNQSLLENEIASPTGGKYYFADDVEQLSGIFGNIGDTISVVTTENVNGKTITGEVIADSGFDIKSNAFSFRNFETIDSKGGSCHGFSMVANGLYLDEFALSKPSNNLYKPSYDVSGIEEFNTGDIYNIKIDDSMLRYGLNVNTDFNYYEIDVNDNKHYIFNSAIRNNLIQYGYSIVDETMFVGNNLFNTVKVEHAYIDVESSSFTDNSRWSDEQQQTMRAIVWWFRDQNDAMEKVINNLFGGLNLKKDSNMSTLTSHLNSGKTAALFMRGDGGHSILAYKIIKESNNPNKYYILIYDNNYPDVPHYIEATQKSFLGIKSYNLSSPDYPNMTDFAIYLYTQG